MRVFAGVLGKLVDEARCLEGRTLRTLADAPGGAILLVFEDGGGAPGERMLVVHAPHRARIHLVPPARPPKRRPAESAFVRDARPHLVGARLHRIEQQGADRVVRLVFDAGATLVAELFGAVPNLLVVDATGVVRAVVHARGGRRPARVGQPYVAPPARASDAPDREVEPSGAAGRVHGEAREDGLPPAPDSDFARAHPFSAAVAGSMAPLDLEAERAAERLRIAAVLQGARERDQRAADGARDVLEQAEQAPRLRELGDLLGASFASIERGRDSVTVDDHYRGGTVAIPIDPALDGRANVDAYYRRARKLERAALVQRERHDALRARIARVDALLAQLAKPTADLATLRDAAEEFAGGRKNRPRPQEGRPAKSARADRARRGAAGIRLLRVPLASGAEILVGRSDADNDLLTTRVARSNDVWLHVHGDAGSHVVIRLGRGKTASLDDLMAAGRLAVHFSKRRGAATCDVIWTPRKYVRKPKGARPGAVVTERFKTLHVRNDAEALRQLLDRASEPGGS